MKKLTEIQKALKTYGKYTAVFRGGDAENNYKVLETLALEGPINAWECAKKILTSYSTKDSLIPIEPKYQDVQSFRSTVNRRFDDLMKQQYVRVVRTDERGNIRIDVVGLTEKGRFLIRLASSKVKENFDRMLQVYQEDSEDAMFWRLFAKHRPPLRVMDLFCRFDQSFLDSGEVNLDEVDPKRIYSLAYRNLLLKLYETFKDVVKGVSKVPSSFKDLSKSDSTFFWEMFSDPEFKSFIAEGVDQAGQDLGEISSGLKQFGRWIRTRTESS